MEQLRSTFEKRAGSRMGRGDVRAAYILLTRRVGKDFAGLEGISIAGVVILGQVQPHGCPQLFARHPNADNAGLGPVPHRVGYERQEILAGADSNLLYLLLHASRLMPRLRRVG